MTFTTPGCTNSDSGLREKLPSLQPAKFIRARSVHRNAKKEIFSGKCNLDVDN
jgi:hypothetical protein